MNPPPRIPVTAVNGRYPAQPRVFRPETVETTVTETEPGTFVVYVDDAHIPVFWLEMTP